MPMGPYRNFDDCVAKMRGKVSDPAAYCGAIKAATEGAADVELPEWAQFLIDVQFVDEDGDGIDDVTGEPVEVVDMPEMDDAEEPMIEADGEREGEDFHALLVVEGTWTGDGRWIEEGALSWRALPLPLMATDRTTEGHMDAALIGSITRVERDGREIHAWGEFVTVDDPDVQRLQQLIRDGALRGISVDLDSVEYDVLMPLTPEVDIDDMDDAGEIEDMGDGKRARRMGMDDMKMKITSARVMGATVVPFPAFEEAFIESLALVAAALPGAPAGVTGFVNMLANYSDLDFSPPVGARQEAQRGLEWRDEFGRGGTAVGVARARDIKNGKSLSPQTINRMASYFARHEVDKEGEGFRPGDDGYPSAGRIAWALWGGDPAWAWVRKLQRQMASRDTRGSMTASTTALAIDAPVLPPADWFTDPRLDGPTPMTVTNEGRIFGHLATWGTCHIGYSDQCVTPPRSAASYAHFLTGEMLCEDGTRVAVGQITMDTGHAPLHANSARAMAHYDDTGAAIADVCVGEDRYGIWMAGSLRPALEPAKVRAIMAADVSGDWRRIGSALELIAILSVNVPGFPKNRIAIREDEGLVASMVASLPAKGCADEMARRTAERIAASIGRSAADRRAELAARIHGSK